MHFIVSIVSFLVPAAIVAVFVWRLADHRADAAERARLLALQPERPARFDAAMIADLPEPARRYFKFTIAEGTLLHRVAEISMTGQFGMGSKQAPNYMNMSAEQTLAAPNGFIWKMRAGIAGLKLSGSDTGKWTRFWMLGIGPVARFGGNQDHKKAAFGRYVAEAVFWTPAALLPGPGVAWQSINDNTARVVVIFEAMSQEVDVTVDEEGRPVEVQFLRWSNANTKKRFCLQPFGGFISEFRTFSGFTVPTHIEAGNHFGTEEYFPFFIANVRDVRFPLAGAAT